MWVTCVRKNAVSVAPLSLPAPLGCAQSLTRLCADGFSGKKVLFRLQGWCLVSLKRVFQPFGVSNTIFPSTCTLRIEKCACHKRSADACSELSVLTAGERETAYTWPPRAASSNRPRLTSDMRDWFCLLLYFIFVLIFVSVFCPSGILLYETSRFFAYFSIGLFAFFLWIYRGGLYISYESCQK